MTSFSASSSCSSLICRYSDGFMTLDPFVPACLAVLSPADKPALERHLVRHARQAGAGGALPQAGDLEQDCARLDDGGPVLRLALALAHARLPGAFRHI